MGYRMEYSVSDYLTLEWGKMKIPLLIEGKSMDAGLGIGRLGVSHRFELFVNSVYIYICD